MNALVYAFIFARGGSKGVPGKNIRQVGGKPLIAHAIACAQASPCVSRIIVSTDDADIAAVARQYGAETPFMRPAHLATDTSPEWAAWRHALESLGCTPSHSPFDVFLSVPATAPLRQPEDLEACARLLLDTDADIVVTVSEARRHPSFNMVRMDPNGSASLASPLPGGIARRQDVPPLFDMTTVAYAARPTFILKANSLFEGKARAVRVPQERALDIDSEYDLAIADYFLTKREEERCARCENS